MIMRKPVVYTVHTLCISNIQHYKTNTCYYLVLICMSFVNKVHEV